MNCNCFAFHFSDRVQEATASPPVSSDEVSGNDLGEKEEGKDEEEGSPYDENEINGKFRITSEHWSDDLNDPASDNYRKVQYIKRIHKKEYLKYLDFSQMSETITRGIHELLEAKSLTDQADFKITILGFRKGSVVCNFKVNYVLREGFVAVPFRLNGTNVTEALGEGFKYQKGVLFQRFVIAAGSFKSSSK